MLRKLTAAASVSVQCGSITVIGSVRNVPVVATDRAFQAVWSSLRPGPEVISKARSVRSRHIYLRLTWPKAQGMRLENGSSKNLRPLMMKMLGFEEVRASKATATNLLGRSGVATSTGAAGPHTPFSRQSPTYLTTITRSVGSRTLPKFPQFEGDWDQEYVPFAVYPTCMRCFERAVYLGTGSRRPSQASLCMNVDGGQSSSTPSLEGGFNETTHGSASYEVTPTLSISEVNIHRHPCNICKPSGHLFARTAKNGRVANGGDRSKQITAIIEEDALNNDMQPV